MEGSGTSEELKKDTSKPSLKPTLNRKRSNSEMALEDIKSSRKPNVKEESEGIDYFLNNFAIILSKNRRKYLLLPLRQVDAQF